MKQSIVDRRIPPKTYDFGTLRLPPATVTKLANGITVHTVSGGDIDVCKIIIILPGGEQESPEAMMSGIAMLALSEGTYRYSGEQIANIFEYNGAWIGSSTSTHHSLLTLHSLNSKLKDVFPVMLEMVLSPTFKEDAVNKILANQSAKLEVEQEKVTYVSGQACNRLMYGIDTPLGREKSPIRLMAMKCADIESFHYSRLDPHGIHVMLSGKITPEIYEFVTKELSRIEPGNSLEPKPLLFPEITDSIEEKIILPESRQSSVRIFIPSIGRCNANYVALRDTVTAFGGYFGSRLMMNIREEKGLTYGISSSLLGYPDRSYICVNTQTDSNNVGKVIDEVNVEIERLKSPDSYSSDEITRLSRFLLSNLAASIDTPFMVMDIYQTAITAGTPPDYFEIQEKLAHNLSPEILAETAKRYFDTAKICSVVAGA